VGIVGGSDLVKICEQLGADSAHPLRALFVCRLRASLCFVLR
jgi:hypothetical protein